MVFLSERGDAERISHPYAAGADGARLVKSYIEHLVCNRCALRGDVGHIDLVLYLEFCGEPSRHGVYRPRAHRKVYREAGYLCAYIHRVVNLYGHIIFLLLVETVNLWLLVVDIVGEIDVGGCGGE